MTLGLGSINFPKFMSYLMSLGSSVPAPAPVSAPVPVLSPSSSSASPISTQQPQATIIRSPSPGLTAGPTSSPGWVHLDVYASRASCASSQGLFSSTWFPTNQCIPAYQYTHGGLSGYLYYTCAAGATSGASLYCSVPVWYCRCTTLVLDCVCASLLPPACLLPTSPIFSILCSLCVVLSCRSLLVGFGGAQTITINQYSVTDSACMGPSEATSALARTCATVNDIPNALYSQGALPILSHTVSFSCTSAHTMPSLPTGNYAVNRRYDSQHCEGQLVGQKIMMENVCFKVYDSTATLLSEKLVWPNVKLYSSGTCRGSPLAVAQLNSTCLSPQSESYYQPDLPAFYAGTNYYSSYYEGDNYYGGARGKKLGQPYSYSQWTRAAAGPGILNPYDPSQIRDELTPDTIAAVVIVSVLLFASMGTILLWRLGLCRSCLSFLFGPPRAYFEVVPQVQVEAVVVGEGHCGGSHCTHEDEAAIPSAVIVTDGGTRERYATAVVVDGEEEADIIFAVGDEADGGRGYAARLGRRAAPVRASVRAPVVAVELSPR